MKIKIVSTFTESPSFNVRILHEGGTIFYNSERLQGNERLLKVANVLDLKVLRVGELEMDVTQAQYDTIRAISEAPIRASTVVTFTTIPKKETP